MKRFWLMPFLLAAGAALSGCAVGDLADRYILKETPAPTEAPAPGGRIYMDEISGLVRAFDGENITIDSNGITHTMSLQDATVECARGILLGEPVSLIYQGRLSDESSGKLSVLKAADQIHAAPPGEEQVFQGTLVSLGTDAVTLLDAEGTTVRFPTTGVKQYYLTGIEAGRLLYVHYLGTLPDPVAGSMTDGNNLKVLSISDVEPYAAPTPSPMPSIMPSPLPEGETPPEQAEASGSQSIRAFIRDMTGGRLSLSPVNSDTVLTPELSQIPCYFPGGICMGSGVNLTCSGTLDPANPSALTVYQIAGDDPASVRNARISSQVRGEVSGRTKNTVTIRTADGTLATCRLENVPDRSTGGLETGAGIAVTFDPAASAQTNILASTEITDAW